MLIICISFPRFRSGVEDTENVNGTTGSFQYPNIGAADTEFASRVDGVEYYCTASNLFGTIRSTNARAFYACKSVRRDSSSCVCMYESC